MVHDMPDIDLGVQARFPTGAGGATPEAGLCLSDMKAREDARRPWKRVALDIVLMAMRSLYRQRRRCSDSLLIERAAASAMPHVLFLMGSHVHHFAACQCITRKYPVNTYSAQILFMVLCCVLMLVLVLSAVKS